MDIGARLKHFRIKNKLSGIEMANLISISQSTYSRYELNKIAIPIDVLMSYCDTLKISIVDFFNVDGGMLLSQSESALIETYRSLDRHDQYLLASIADTLKNRKNILK